MATLVNSIQTSSWQVGSIPNSQGCYQVMRTFDPVEQLQRKFDEYCVDQQSTLNALYKTYLTQGQRIQHLEEQVHTLQQAMQALLAEQLRSDTTAAVVARATPIDAITENPIDILASLGFPALNSEC